ncbi:MAG: substrate-binding domain-containing protein [SAR324 cluster bacterium]|nr:substrate-binding domain-containing protein [SAR324 cluster bacterium]
MAISDSRSLRLATTSSVQESGLLGALCEDYLALRGRVVEVQAVGTGQALRMGRRGEVDAVITHNAAYELQFVEAGHGVNRREFMTNDFVLVGPQKDPAGAARAPTVFDALAAIFRGRAQFISRGDDSGTNLREIDLWAASAALPFGQPWYRAVPGGMVQCLAAASAQGAYTLVDMGTFLAQAEGLELRILCADPRHLRNAYSVIAVNPARHASVDYEEAMALITYLTGAAGQRLIKEFRKGAHPLFYPLWDPQPAGERAGPASATESSQGGKLGRVR